MLKAHVGHVKLVATPQRGKSSSGVDTSALQLQPSTAVAVSARRTAGRRAVEKDRAVSVLIRHAFGGHVHGGGCAASELG